MPPLLFCTIFGQLQPDSAQAHSSLGNALRVKGDLQTAIQECREALRLFPNYAGAHNNLGLTLAERGEFDTAMAEFSEALRLEPNNADVHANLALFLIQKSGYWNPIGAVTHAELSVKLSRGKKAAYYDVLAEALFATKKLTEAIQAERMALELAPNDPTYRRNLERLTAASEKSASH